jgi:hypothetical protein
MNAFFIIPKNVQMMKGKRQLRDDAWSISIQETEALISLLYGRGY